MLCKYSYYYRAVYRIVGEVGHVWNHVYLIQPASGKSSFRRNAQAALGLRLTCRDKSDSTSF